MEKGLINRMVLANRTILMYIANESKRKQIEALCARLSITAKQLKPSDMNNTVGGLVGIKGIGGQKNINIPFGYMLPELMIFSGIDDKKLDVFLESYRNEGIEKVELKAIVTPHNIKWTLYELVQELKKENTSIR